MRVFFLLCICACASSIDARAQTGTGILPQRADSLRLSRAEAVSLALGNNPQLEIARQQTNQFRAGRVAATAIPDPQISASLDNQSGFFRSGSGGEKNVAAGLTIPFPDKFRLQYKVATGDVKSADAAYRALTTQLAALTQSAYDSLLLALRHRSDVLLSKQLSEDFLKRTEARFQGGMVPRLDVMKARVDVAQATNDLIASERDISNAQATLNRLTGRALSLPIIPTDSLDLPPDLPAVEQLEGIALFARAELAGVAAQRAGASAATSLAKEFWLPDLTMGVARDVSPGTPPAAFSTGLAFPFPVFFWQHSRGEIAQSRYRERELAATERDLRAAIGEDVRTTYSTAEAALLQARYIRDELLPAAQEAYRSANAAYQIGGSSALEVIEARRTLLDAQAQLTAALAEANTSRSDLERAVGAPLNALPTIPPRTNAK
jgi:cobalt-zinc-cadmium efflux system outer membrane protein